MSNVFLFAPDRLFTILVGLATSACKRAKVAFKGNENNAGVIYGITETKKVKIEDKDEKGKT
jgi:hypothetical protein